MAPLEMHLKRHRPEQPDKESYGALQLPPNQRKAEIQLQQETADARASFYVSVHRLLFMGLASLFFT